MTKKQPTWILKSIRLPKDLMNKIDFYVSEHQKRTGFQISQSAVIRTFLEEGLKNRGITDNLYEGHPGSYITQESSSEK